MEGLQTFKKNKNNPPQKNKAVLPLQGRVQPSASPPWALVTLSTVTLTQCSWKQVPAKMGAAATMGKQTSKQTNKPKNKQKGKDACVSVACVVSAAVSCRRLIGSKQHVLGQTCHLWLHRHITISTTLQYTRSLEPFFHNSNGQSF